MPFPAFAFVAAPFRAASLLLGVRNVAGETSRPETAVPRQSPTPQSRVGRATTDQSAVEWRALERNIWRNEMLQRRNFMKTCSAIGLAGTLFPGVLWAQAQAEGTKKITKEMIEKQSLIGD